MLLRPLNSMHKSRLNDFWNIGFYQSIMKKTDRGQPRLSLWPSWNHDDRSAIQLWFWLWKLADWHWSKGITVLGRNYSFSSSCLFHPAVDTGSFWKKRTLLWSSLSRGTKIWHVKNNNKFRTHVPESNHRNKPNTHPYLENWIGLVSAGITADNETGAT